jgi:hypothetical protein
MRKERVLVVGGGGYLGGGEGGIWGGGEGGIGPISKM